MATTKFRLTTTVAKAWLPDAKYARGGKVFDVDERLEDFEIEIDVDAICELVARDAAQHRNGKSSQMMGLVKARHVRGKIGLVAPGKARGRRT